MIQYYVKNTPKRIALWDEENSLYDKRLMITWAAVTALGVFNIKVTFIDLKLLMSLYTNSLFA